MIVDGVNQLLDSGIQPIQMLLNVLAHRLPSHLQAVAFLGAHGLQGVQA
jgi:hypothetical protein